MDTPTDLLFRLPQSVIRSLGIPSLEFMNLSQVNMRRNQTSLESIDRENAVYEVNFNIFNSIYPNASITSLNLAASNILMPEIATVDSNLLSAIDLYPNLKKINSVFALPYASHVTSPKVNDLIHLKNFARCLKYSYLSNKKIQVDFYYDWASMILKDSSTNYLPWFWKSTRLDIDLYVSRIQIIAKSFSLKYDFFHKFMNSKKPILLLATEYQNGPTILEKLTNLYTTSPNFKIKIHQGNAEIFLKSHRTVPLPKNGLPSKFMNVPIIVAENLSETAIPAELFINSGKDISLVSEFGSTVFNYQVGKFIALPSSTDISYISAHGLIVDRMKKYCEIDVTNEFCHVDR
jgi:hypothetical protein